MWLFRKEETKEIWNNDYKKDIERVTVTDNYYRRRMNFQVEEILGEDNTTTLIKMQQMKWYGYINRKEEHSALKKITSWKSSGNRSRARPKVRWEDQIVNSIRTMGITNLREKMSIEIGIKICLEPSRNMKLWRWQAVD